MDRFEFVNLTTDDTPPIVRHWQAILRRVYQQIARDDVSSADMEFLSNEFSPLCRGKWEVNSEGRCEGVLWLPPAHVIADVIIAGQAATEIEIKEAQDFAEGIADALASICEARPGQLCICRQCGNIARARSILRKYCSQRCRQKAYESRHKTKALVTA